MWYQQRYSSTVLHCWTHIDIVYFGIMFTAVQNQTTDMKAQCRYGEHWGITAFPTTCSWRVKSGPQQGRLETVRYSPGAVPTRLGQLARLYRTTLSSGNFMLLRVYAPYWTSARVLLLYLYCSPKQALFFRATFLVRPKKCITFLLGTFLLAGLHFLYS